MSLSFWAILPVDWR